MTSSAIRTAPLSAAALAAATPADRDRYVDALRVLSIGVVVLGHWLMLTLQVDDGRLRAGNVLAELPAAQLLTWVFQVMPLFFLVGGAAHAAALRSHRARGGRYPEFLVARLRRLLAPTAVFLAVWCAIAAATELAGVQAGDGTVAELTRTATRTVVQPLWFLGVYLGIVALAPAMHAAHRRWGVAVPVVLVLGAAGVDAARLLGGVEAIGALNMALVWLAAHQVGFLYADGRLTRRVGLALAGGGLAATTLLTAVLGWYPVSMVGLPGAPVSNMSPPTLALVAHGAWLTGLVVLARGPVTRWLARPRVWTTVVAANGVVMTVFLWHLTALFVVAAAVAAGLGMPEPGGAVWWLTRPVWVAVLAAIAVPLVLAVRRFERPAARPAPRNRVNRGLDGMAAGVGAALATGGMLAVSVTGLNGLLAERTAHLVGVPVTAWGSLAALGIGWALVRAAGR
ncbi:acyltransferase family protein [Cryptosporangium aurantiacum]|uniref:Acyltransferase family protein n=1 Tax=Cryptosporangium aurantiacum TaxID=134849 RepID=A0A1M7IM75_9ACTN|nr:acyltransferase [Cryptosporangium aurantiacum]SHM41703.1 Acyltransferase family protein [Cryptosporangium aurantiacum]